VTRHGRQRSFLHLVTIAALRAFDWYHLNYRVAENGLLALGLLHLTEQRLVLIGLLSDAP
jgi:hypothetical protein